VIEVNRAQDSNAYPAMQRCTPVAMFARIVKLAIVSASCFVLG
jgi:hypothetical protein